MELDQLQIKDLTTVIENNVKSMRTLGQWTNIPTWNAIATNLNFDTSLDANETLKGFNLKEITGVRLRTIVKDNIPNLYERVNSYVQTAEREIAIRTKNHSLFESTQKDEEEKFLGVFLDDTRDIAIRNEFKARLTKNMKPKEIIELLKTVTNEMYANEIAEVKKNTTLEQQG